MRNEKKRSTKVNAHKAGGPTNQNGNISLHLDIIDSSNIHNVQLQEMENEIITLRNENELYKDKIKELEKWLVMLLNNFYEGNPSSLKAIEEGFKAIEELRQDKFSLQKALLLQKKQNIDLQNQFLDYRKLVQQKEDELKDASDPQKILLEKHHLEQTLVTLSEEVEALSQKNEQLLKDLLKLDFYEEYAKVQNEVNYYYIINQIWQFENLQQAHFALINTIEVSNNSTLGFNNRKSSKSLAPLNTSPKSSFICGLDQQTSSTFHKENNQLSKTFHLGGRSSGQSKNSFLSFLSCNGCSSNTAAGVMPRVNSNHQLINNYPYKEDFESIIRRQDINFLSNGDKFIFRDTHKINRDNDTTINSKTISKNSPFDNSIIKNMKGELKNKDLPRKIL